MNLLLRLILLVPRARRRPPRGPLDESVIHARVLPTDPDLDFHLNDGRSLTLMDFGRVDLMVRTGMVGELRRRRGNPVIASVTIRFRRPRGPWRRLAIHAAALLGRRRGGACRGGGWWTPRPGAGLAADAGGRAPVGGGGDPGRRTARGA